jgi:hypothetical protein
MAGHEMRLHGTDEHKPERQARHGPDLAQSVAIFTAILSTVGALVSYQGAATQNESMLYKNEAVLKTTQASDQWNFYQSKSIKGHLMELAMDTAPVEKKAFYRQQLARYEQEKQEIRVKAEALGRESRTASDKSELLMRPHHRLAQAMILIQIAISLASITALTRKRWLFALAAAAAAGGLGVSAAVVFGV